MVTAVCSYAVALGCSPERAQRGLICPTLAGRRDRAGAQALQRPLRRDRRRPGEARGRGVARAAGASEVVQRRRPMTPSNLRSRLLR